MSEFLQNLRERAPTQFALYLNFLLTPILRLPTKTERRKIGRLIRKWRRWEKDEKQREAAKMREAEKWFTNLTLELQRHGHDIVPRRSHEKN